jgi:hypothetical protein
MAMWLSGGESDQDCDDIFIAVEDRSWMVRGGWSAAVAQIQCFGFSSRGDATG